MNSISGNVDQISDEKSFESNIISPHYSSESDCDFSDRDVDGLINDEPESSPTSSGRENSIHQKNKTRKRRKGSEFLEDDDYELLEENLGISVVKRHRYRRVRVGSSGDEGVNDIESDLFPNEEPFKKLSRQSSPISQTMDLDIHSSSDPEDVDDFIVDDEGHPIRKHRCKYFQSHFQLLSGAPPPVFIEKSQDLS